MPGSIFGDFKGVRPTCRHRFRSASDSYGAYAEFTQRGARLTWCVSSSLSCRFRQGCIRYQGIQNLGQCDFFNVRRASSDLSRGKSLRGWGRGSRPDVVCCARFQIQTFLLAVAGPLKAISRVSLVRPASKRTFAESGLGPANAPQVGFDLPRLDALTLAGVDAEK